MKKLAKCISNSCTKDIKLAVVRAVIISSDNVKTDENESIKSIPDPIQDGSSVCVLKKAALENATEFRDTRNIILANLKQLNLDCTLSPSKSQSKR